MDFINSYYEFIGEPKRFAFTDISYQALISPETMDVADMYADIRCTLNNGEIILLEAYTSFGKEEYNKSYNYTYRTYSNQMTYKNKPRYRDCKKVTCLNLIPSNYQDSNNYLVNGYVPKHKITNKVIEKGETELVLIRLDKAKNYLIQWEYEERFIRWLKIINATSIKEMENIGRSDVIMEQSIEFLKWYRKEYDSWHEELKESEAIGEKRGIELGEAIGEARGELRGKQLGEKRGIEKNQLKTAKNLLKMGIDIETIIKATGISKTALKKIQN